MTGCLKSAILFMLLGLPASYHAVYGQLSQDSFLRQKFEKYTASVPWEEVYVHTDREVYIAGEDIWFNIYVTDRKSMKPSASTRIAYVELLAPGNRPVFQGKILLETGSGSGHAAIPDTLHSGSYTLRAWTSWNRNFMPFSGFTRELIVCNSLDAAFQTFMNTAGAENVQTLNNLTVTSNSAKGIAIESRKAPDSLIIRMICDEEFVRNNMGMICLFIETHGNIDLIRPQRITAGWNETAIPKQKLLQGINHITLFDAGNKPVAEKYVLNCNDTEKHVFTAPDSLGRRQDTDISFVPYPKTPELNKEAHFSISVSRQPDERSISRMSDYLLTGTEFGKDGMLLTRWKNLTGVREESADSLLSHLRSRWIDWQSVLSDGRAAAGYEHETVNHFLTGRLVSSQGTTSVSAKRLFMCSPGGQAQFQYAISDSNGYFSFSLPADEKVRDLIVMPDDTSNQYKVIIDSPFDEFTEKQDVKAVTAERSFTDLVTDMSVNYQTSRLYNKTDRVKSEKAQDAGRPPQRFYGKPDMELVLADYLSLPVMSEVFTELLPHIYLRKKKGGYTISVIDRKNDIIISENPVLMIDGVIIRDASLIAGLDPSIVERIDVIREKYEVGTYIFTGIINVITKSADFSCVSLPDYMARIHYRCIDPAPTWNASGTVAAAQGRSRIPDMRSTLFWTPRTIPGKDGTTTIRFRSSDAPGEYYIHLEGFTGEGKIISVIKPLRVFNESSRKIRPELF